MKNNEELTGIDTWHLVSPILANHMDKKEFGLLDKAYVMVFCALKYWDECHKDKGDKK